MALNLIQSDIQRSIYEAIRLVCVQEGYTPDITLYTADAAGQALYDVALSTIRSSKGFAIEIFSASSNQQKGIKKPPRITIHPARVIPGDIGLDSYAGGVRKKVSDPDKWVRFKPPHDTTMMQFDIHLVTATAEQDVILTAILFKAIGVRKFLTRYNAPNEVFLIRNYDFYDSFDLPEGINEKISSFEVPDIILSDEPETDVSLIKDIKTDIYVGDEETPGDSMHFDDIP
jgi:hypothetical protein